MEGEKKSVFQFLEHNTNMEGEEAPLFQFLEYNTKVVEKVITFQKICQKMPSIWFWSWLFFKRNENVD